MNKMLIALSAAALALALTPAAQAGFTVPSLSPKTLVQKACDDGDYAEERAEARAEALEDGAGFASRQASLPEQPRAQAAAEPEQPATPAAKSTADATGKPDDKTEAKTETKKAEFAEPKKSESKSVASADAKSCKKYFSSVGMTLSVPCE